MNVLSGIPLVFRNAFFATLRGKRLIVLLLLAGLPVLVSYLTVVNATVIELDAFVQTLLFVAFQITLPFAALFLGIAVLGDEIDGRTITYLYTRPLPRPAFLLGRLSGVAAAYGALLVASVLACGLLYARALDLALGDVAAAAAIALGGFLAYISLFAALRALTKRALFVGLGLVFLVEIFLSKIPFGSLAQISIWHHLTLLTTRLFGVEALDLPAIGTDETVSGSITALACVLLGSLAVGCWIVKSREVQVPAAAG